MVLLGRVRRPRPSLLRAGLGLLNPLLSSREACGNVFDALSPWGGTVLVRMPESCVHMLGVGPPGSGKTQGLVLTWLKTCPDSAFVTDVKPEIVQAVARHREQEFGHRSIIIDPDCLTTKHPDTLNQLDSIRPASAFEDIYSLATEFVVRTGQEDGDAVHFLDAAELWISAMLACCLAHAEDGRPSLQLVRTALTNPEQMEAAKTLLRGSGGLLARLGHQLGHYVDREFGSAITTANRFMRWLDSPSMAASTAESSFDIHTVWDRPTTVYIVCQQERLLSRAGWVRATIGALIRSAIRGGVRRDRLVHGLIDEAPAVLPLPCIDTALAVGRGFGLRLQLYVQAVAQLKKCFPNGQDAAVLATTSQVFTGINDLETGKYVSERCGEETILVASGGNNDGWSFSWSDGFGPGGRSLSFGRNDGWQQQPRRLLTPTEACGLGRGVAVSFPAGLGVPVMTQLAMAYEEPSLGRRPGFLRRTVSALKALLAAVALLLAAVAVLAALPPKPGARPIRPKADEFQFFPTKGR